MTRLIIPGDCRAHIAVSGTLLRRALRNLAHAREEAQGAPIDSYLEMLQATLTDATEQLEKLQVLGFKRTEDRRGLHPNAIANGSHGRLTDRKV